MHAVAPARYLEGEYALDRGLRGEVAADALHRGRSGALRDAYSGGLLREHEYVAALGLLRPDLVRRVAEKYAHSRKSRVEAQNIFPVERLYPARLEGHLPEDYAVGDGDGRVALKIEVRYRVNDEAAAVRHGGDEAQRTVADAVDLFFRPALYKVVGELLRRHIHEHGAEFVGYAPVEAFEAEDVVDQLFPDLGTRYRLGESPVEIEDLRAVGAQYIRKVVVLALRLFEP